MLIEAMTEHECRAVLAGAHIVAHLGCARNNQPYVVPLHLHLDGECLYGYSTLGQKIEWMRANPLVCLEVDELTSDWQWASVIVFGQYEELPDTPANEESRLVAERILQKHPMWWEPALVPLAAHEPRFPVVFRIRIASVAGRRATADGAAHEPASASDVKHPSGLPAVLRRLRGRRE